MTKEILKGINGIEFHIEYDSILTSEQKKQILDDLNRNIQLSHTNQSLGQIMTLATCPPGPKTVGQNVTIQSAPTGGQPPWFITFKKGATVLNATPIQLNSGYTVPAEYTYGPLTVADAAASPILFTASVTDSCTVPGPQTTEDPGCSVIVNYATCAALTCTMTGCPATPIAPGTAVNLTMTPTGGTSPYAYRWTLNGTEVGTAATYSTSTLVAGTSNIIVCTVIDTCLPLKQTCAQSCTVNVSCSTIGVGLTIL